MENAVKALYIAAGMLMAIMVLSLAVTLYSGLQSYVKQADDQIKFNDVNSFNTQFLNYAGSDNLKIQDVVTAASIAYENNKNINPDTNVWNTNTSENSFYVEVNLVGWRSYR